MGGHNGLRGRGENGLLVFGNNFSGENRLRGLGAYVAAQSTVTPFARQRAVFVRRVADRTSEHGDPNSVRSERLYLCAAILEQVSNQMPEMSSAGFSVLSSN